MVSSEEKTMALLSHILCVVVGILAPLIIWLIKKDQSHYVAEHAKESLNFQISVLIYSVVSSVLMVVAIGFILLPAVGVFMVIFAIIATIKASNGEMYRYPLTIRLVK